MSTNESGIGLQYKIINDILMNCLAVVHFDYNLPGANKWFSSYGFGRLGYKYGHL